MIEVPRIAVFMGKGGVGKSTATVRYARELLDEGLRVEAVSLDPSHALIDYLADIKDHPRLSICAFDGRGAAAASVEKNGPLIAEIVAAGTYFEAEELRDLFFDAWPGADEWLGYWSILERLEGPIDHLLIDLAPGPHARQFLLAHQHIKGWLDLLDTLLHRRRYLRERLQKSSPAPRGEDLGGSASPDNGDPLERFLQEKQTHLQQVQKCVQQEAGIYFVSTPARDSVDEIRSLFEATIDAGWKPEEIILNRYDGPPDGLSEVVEPLADLGVKLTIWPTNSSANNKPQPPTEQRPPLEGQKLFRFNEIDCTARELHFISGKGGVGKTTLSLQLAQKIAIQSSRKVGWLSLDTGQVPERIPELSESVLVDPILEIDEIIDELHNEWQRALRTPANMEIPFEQRAADAILGLRPPGFELLAPVFAIGRRLLDRDVDTWVVDGPATGHLLRLWTALEHGESWLTAALVLLDRQRSLLSLPRLTRRLLQWRRCLRRLQQVAADPERGQTWIITSAQSQSLEQAEQLHQAAHYQGWNVGGIILNDRHSERSNPKAIAHG